MALETEYLGFTIVFADNEEVWRCWELNVEHKSLSKCKALISHKVREEIATASLICGLRTWGSVKKVQVVGLIDGKPDQVRVKSLEDDERRTLEKMSDLFRWSPENEALLAEADRLANEARDLSKRAEKTREQIKMMSAHDVATFIASIREKVQS